MVCLEYHASQTAATWPDNQWTLYSQQLKCVHEKLKNMEPALVNHRGVILLQAMQSHMLLRSSVKPLSNLVVKH